MDLLYVYPGDNFGLFDEFINNSEVRIGYRLFLNLFKLDVDKRKKEIRKIISKKKKYTEQALKAEVTRLNYFFDSKIKFGFIPTKGFKSFIVFKLDSNVKYDNNTKTTMRQVRKYKFIKEIFNSNNYVNYKGIAKVKSEKIEGIDSLLKKYQSITPSESYSENEKEEQLLGLEKAANEKLRVHLKRERDIRFRNKYRNKYRNIKSCPACSFNANFKYDLDNPNSILEMHHIVPLKNIKKDMSIKEKDVSLLCPNCHRAIHKMMSINQVETITIKDFKKSITK